MSRQAVSHPLLIMLWNPEIEESIEEYETAFLARVYFFFGQPTVKWQIFL